MVDEFIFKLSKPEEYQQWYGFLKNRLKAKSLWKYCNPDTKEEPTETKSNAKEQVINQACYEIFNTLDPEIARLMTTFDDPRQLLADIKERFDQGSKTIYDAIDRLHNIKMAHSGEAEKACRKLEELHTILTQRGAVPEQFLIAILTDILPTSLLSLAAEIRGDDGISIKLAIEKVKDKARRINREYLHKRLAKPIEKPSTRRVNINNPPKQTKTKWILDSGATHHTVNNKDIIDHGTIQQTNQHISDASGNKQQIKGIGTVTTTINGMTIKFNDVRIVPEFKDCLLSSYQLEMEGYDPVITGTNGSIKIGNERINITE
ncbi:hypothetical protein H4219_004118, partial [Mycoemilia scoparia]